MLLALHQDKHKAPPLPASAPCPYRVAADISNHYPFRLEQFIRVRTSDDAHGMRTRFIASLQTGYEGDR